MKYYTFTGIASMWTDFHYLDLVNKGINDWKIKLVVQHMMFVKCGIYKEDTFRDLKIVLGDVSDYVYQIVSMLNNVCPSLYHKAQDLFPKESFERLLKDKEI